MHSTWQSPALAWCTTAIPSRRWDFGPFGAHQCLFHFGISRIVDHHFLAFLGPGTADPRTANLLIKEIHIQYILYILYFLKKHVIDIWYMIHISIYICNYTVCIYIYVYITNQCISQTGSLGPCPAPGHPQRHLGAGAAAGAGARGASGAGAGGDGRAVGCEWETMGKP